MGNLLKKRIDVYLYYWVIPFFIGFFLLNHYMPYSQIESLDIGFMVSVVSFLFGFFITISFSMIMTRVSALRESLATETGRLVSLFLLSKHLGENFHKKISEIIDKYTILTLRHYSNYNVGRNLLYEMNDDLKDIDLKTEKQKTIANSFLYLLGEFEPTRERLEYLTKGKLLRALKITNYALAVLLMGLLFLNRGNFFTDSLFIVLSTVIIFILLIIEDYENLKIGDYVTNISNSEQLFDLIGTPRYYPSFLLGRVKLEKGRTYRIGFYNSKTKTEEIATLQYNPGFNLRLQTLFEKFRKKQNPF